MSSHAKIAKKPSLISSENLAQLPTKPVRYNPFKSVYFAIRGTVTGFQREPSLSAQLIIGILTTSILISQNFYFLAMVNLVMMFFTLSSEFFNTAIEAVCDLVHPTYSLKVKLIKDLAAAGVWMVALGWLMLMIYSLYIVVF